MLLTEIQAERLYAAMKCANDIDAVFRFTVKHADGTAIIVEEAEQSWAVLIRISDGTIAEHYESQPAFAQAYGIPV